MSTKRKPYKTCTREFKLEAVRRLSTGDRTIAEVARELKIGAALLGRWKAQYEAEADEAFPGKGRLKDSDERVRRLEREVRCTSSNDWDF